MKGGDTEPAQFLASLAYDDGRTDVHLLSDEFVTHSAQEMVAVRVLLYPARPAPAGQSARV